MKVDEEYYQWHRYSQKLIEKQESLEKEIQDTRHQLEQELKNRQQISQLTEEIVQYKNEKVALERSLEIRSQEIQEENKNLTQEKERAEKEKESLQVQFEEHKKILESCEKRLIEVNRDNEDMEKQLESIKSLWMELQHKYEKEQLKNKSLNKLNKQLSKKISLDKKEKAIERAQEDPLPKNEDSSFNERLSEIYSSQFGPLNKKNLDL